MIKPDILIKSNRKTLTLTINDEGKLIVRAPQKMEMEDVFNFIEKKEKWIKQKQHKIVNILKANSKIINYEQVLFLGKLYTVVIVKGIKEINLNSNYLCIPAKIKQERVVNAIKKWYIYMAEEVVLERLDYLCELMGLDFNSVKFVNSRAKWGSCDQHYNLAFNFKMVMLTPALIDYIIIHELAHILQLNHSKQFWEIVNSVMPGYSKQRELLKNSGFLLKLFVKTKVKKQVELLKK